MSDTLLPASDLLLSGARVSVQRATRTPRDGHSPNLGAASCIVLSADPHSLHLAVAVPPDEELWIGLSLAPDTTLVSARIGDLPLQLQNLGVDSDGGRFLRSASFGGVRAESIEIIVCVGDDVAQMKLESSSLQSFIAQFGVAEQRNPSPTTYGGWRLP